MGELARMTKKRRNNGRNKKNRGHVKRVVCCLSGKHIPKDKSVKRFVVRNIVEASAMRDIRDVACTRTTCCQRCTTSSTTPLRLPSITVLSVCGPGRLVATVLLLQGSTAPVRTMVLHVLARLQVVPLAATGQVVLLLVPLPLQLLRPTLL